MFTPPGPGSLSSCTMGSDATGVDDATDDGDVDDVTKDDGVSDCSLKLGSTELFLLLKYLFLFGRFNTGFSGSLARNSFLSCAIAAREL